ncbi:hypothetical protein I6J22_06215 [Corynebacterium kroppenstedtii]|uniref:Uncharacterized protein n=1 Tax=Corynebacterium kroppenstedtii (strain DSM 44385 / JCM 11950 / CIP 105744 / CCUG 35717) TaxID=645127 RepID=C4LLU7_CORK4|nr:hypothetical protein [Corynebacterium kroppenstedtii]ACR16852.1 hypothetical protein ckrop_0055 [Corynebacterium kroppenstedtii DSM 44385]QRP09849.1 hypothetical protein I6J22_06215 [Corynebacterium kroppenstedtii]
MDEVETWCFFTKFVCRYDDLDQAKARHQRCVDALRITNTVHFSSEDAYQAGHTEPTFRLLLTEIIPPGKEITPEKKKEYKEEYSVFVFVTIVDIPNTPDSDGDEVRIVGEKLEIDFEEGLPARFPSRTRGIRVSRTGNEINGCIYQ